jgi:hypothetical protein
MPCPYKDDRLMFYHNISLVVPCRKRMLVQDDIHRSAVANVCVSLSYIALI